jgi:hypothetical protein
MRLPKLKESRSAPAGAAHLPNRSTGRLKAFKTLVVGSQTYALTLKSSA